MLRDRCWGFGETLKQWGADKFSHLLIYFIKEKIYSHMGHFIREGEQESEEQQR